MVPLTEADAEDMEVGQPKSATQFFSIPQPKRKSKPAEPPPSAPPSAAPGASPPPGMAPPGGGSMAPSMGMGMGMGIQGPVAGAPPSMAPQMQSHPGTMPHGQGGAEGSRAQSYRVFAIVAGLMFMVMSALVLSVGLAVGGLYWSNQAEPTATNQPNIAPRPERTKKVDTGTAAAPPPIKPPPKPRPTTARPRPTTTPVPAAPAPPPPPAATGSATVIVPATASFTAVEVKCPGGFRDRASFSGGKATVPDVPNMECDMFFKGGLPAKNKIRGGQTKNCTFSGGQAVCN